MFFWWGGIQNFPTPSGNKRAVPQFKSVKYPIQSSFLLMIACLKGQLWSFVPLEAKSATCT